MVAEGFAEGDILLLADELHAVSQEDWVDIGGDLDLLGRQTNFLNHCAEVECGVGGSRGETKRKSASSAALTLCGATSSPAPAYRAGRCGGRSGDYWPRLAEAALSRVLPWGPVRGCSLAVDVEIAQDVDGHMAALAPALFSWIMCPRFGSEMALVQN